ncbi:energy transducer TonB [Saccharobesus litoralis]
MFFRLLKLTLLTLSLCSVSNLTLACDSKPKKVEPCQKKAGLNKGTRPKIIKRQQPKYPMDELRAGREGWAKLNFAIDPNGRVKHIEIVDHSGTASFAHSAREAVRKWRFDPATQNGEPVYSCRNSVQLDFGISKKRNGASEEFIKQFNKVKQFAATDDTKLFKTSLAKLKKLSFKRYERARYYLMAGIYAHRIGDTEGQIAALERVKNYGKTSIGAEIYIQSVRDLYLAQMDSGLFTQGLETHKTLAKFDDPNATTYQAITQHKNQVVELLASDKLIATTKKIQAKKRFAYLPLSRKSFSIKPIEGDLSKLQMRCGYNYSEHKITEDKVWHTPEEWGKCAIHVYGESGASFKVIEHPA